MANPPHGERKQQEEWGHGSCLLQKWGPSSGTLLERTVELGKVLAAQNLTFTPLAMAHPSFPPTHPRDMHSLALRAGSKVQKFPANAAPSPHYAVRE